MIKTPLRSQSNDEDDKFNHEINPVQLNDDSDGSENSPDCPPPFALSGFPPPSKQFTAEEEQNG